MRTAGVTPKTAKFSPLNLATPGSSHSPHIHHKLHQTANASKDLKSRGRGITSSIWANSSPATRKAKGFGPHEKARAASLPLLTTASYAHREVHQSDPASSPATRRNSPKSAPSPRLADAIALLKISTPSPSNLDVALGHIIAFPLYDLLLLQLGRGQPALLRQFLGAADPGPGHWTGADSIQLLLRGWQYGLQNAYGIHHAPPTSPSPETCFEAASWLHGFLVEHTTAGSQGKGNAKMTCIPTSQRTYAAEALRILLVRHAPEWWLETQHVQAIEQVIAWVLSA